MTEVLDVSFNRRTPVSPTYSELPDSVSHGLAALAERVQELVTKGAVDVRSAERLLVASLSEVGRSVMGEVLARHDPDGDVVLDGQRYWQAVRSTQQYMCLFGRITVERGVYRAVRNGPTICPMELRAGIVEGFWTHDAARLAASCISDMTPYRAETFFRELGMMTPSRSSLDRLPKALNKHWESRRESYEQRLRASEKIPDDAVTVAVSLDGVLVPMRGSNKAQKRAATRREGRADKGPAGYKEVGCGALIFYDVAGTRLLTRRLARMPEPKQKTLKEQLRSELEHVLTQRPDLVVVALADGSANNWDFLPTLPCRYEVVDFFHAVEHLKRALDIGMGASALNTQREFQRLRRVLRDSPSGIDIVIRALKRRKRRHGSHRDYRTGVSYFTRHRDRMHYSKLQRRSLPIGSGVIEGTCKSLASDRLKRAGMRWDLRGGQAILNLRAWSQSDRFDAAWDLLHENYRANVSDIAAAA